MFKIAVAFSLILTICLVAFWFFYPKATSKKDNNTGGEIRGVETAGSKKGSEGVETLKKSITDVKEAVGENLQNAKENIHDTLQSTLDLTFGEKSKSDNVVSVQIQENKGESTTDLYSIDLSSGKELKFKFVKSKSYFLKFQNIPSDYCLFINENKYPLDEKNLIELKFISNGTYYLKTNSCSSSEKNVGEITVD